MGNDNKRDASLADRIIDWFDSRLGLSYEMLRPAPQYSLNPFYWLGALTVVAFIIQSITGIIMMLYYVPSPSDAYSSTLYIFGKVNYGRFLETVHLYTAYAMIILAFMHMMRGYFVSVHKKPREMMWLVGMAMGFVTLGFGFTGYLLPWTVVSKSATDVGMGMIDTLPPDVATFLKFLIVGAGGDATVLLRFYDLHVVVLPAVILLLLMTKMYLLEAHGISEPVTGKYPLPEEKRRLVPIFPDASLYVLELCALFGAAMLFISALFPLDLPPQYTPQLASQYTPQPDWYFLWIYQILKISIFEGPALPIALVISTLVFLALLLLPFIDRAQTRRLRMRPKFVTTGVIFVTELVILSYWGIITPGQIIPVEQAIVVLGGVALIIVLVSFFLYSKVRMGTETAPIIGGVSPTAVRTRSLKVGAVFASFVAFGAFSIGGLLDTVVNIALGGISLLRVEQLLFSVLALGTVLASTVYLMRRAGSEHV